MVPQFLRVGPAQREEGTEDNDSNEFSNPLPPSFAPDEQLEAAIGPSSALQQVMTRSRPEMMEIAWAQRQEGASCLSLWHAVRDRFFFRNEALEADYLVFYLRDRMTPTVVVALITIAGLVSFVSSLLQFRRDAPSIALRGTAAAMWVLGSIALMWLTRDWRCLVERFGSIAHGEADDDIVEVAEESGERAQFGGKLGHFNKRNDAILSGGGGRAFSRHSVVVRQRSNARLQELALLWCNATFFVLSFSNFLTKGDCALPAEWPDRVHNCMNTIHIDAAVLLAYGLCASICRTRCLLQSALITACTSMYLIAVSVTPTSTGFPSTATQRSFLVVVVVVAVLTMATIMFVDRQARRHFMDMRKLERHRDEASRLAKYNKRIASSVLPSAIVARLSRGGAVKDMLQDCAVCCIGFHCWAQTFIEWSPHEFVQALQRYKLLLDAAARELKHAITKVHTMGDQQMVVVAGPGSGSYGFGEGEDPDALPMLEPPSASSHPQSRALDRMLVFLRRFVEGVSNAMDAVTRSDGCSDTSLEDCSQSTSDMRRRAVQCGLEPVAAVACGSVFLASIGSQCLIALGHTAHTTRSLVRLARRQRNTGAATTSLGNDNNDSVCATLRFCTTAARLLPQCPHRFTEPLQAMQAPPTNADTTAPAVSFRLDLASWCPSSFLSSNASIGPSSNPLDPEDNQLTYSSVSTSGANRWTAHRLSAVVVEFIDCAATLQPQGQLEDTVNQGGETSSRSTDHQGPPLGLRGAKSYGPFSNTSSRERIPPRDHAGPISTVSNASGGDPFALKRVYLVGSQFIDGDVEYAYHAYVGNTDDRGRSQWEFICMLCIGISMLVVFFISTDSSSHGPATSALTVSKPLFWVLATCSSAGIGVLLSLCVDGPVVNALLRLIEFVYWGAYVLSCVFTTNFQTILGSELLWFVILLELSALRERCQGLKFHCAMVVALAGSFFASILLKYPGGSFAVSSMLLIVATSCVGIACFVLWDRFRREQYATTCMLEYVQQQYANDVVRLERIIEAMIPSAVAGKLMNVVRGALRKSDEGASNPATLGGTGCLKPMLRTHNLWRSPFTSTIDDIPLLVTKVFPGLRSWRTPSSVRHDERDRWNEKRLHSVVAAFERTRFIALSVLSAFPSLCLVKFTGDSFMVADQTKRETTEMALLLVRAAVRIARELQASNIVASTALTSGPLVGAVLGTTALTYEYYGHAASSGMALLEELPRGEVYASSRFARQVDQQVLPPLVQCIETINRVGSTISRTECDVTFGPVQRLALRGVGIVYVHRVIGRWEE